MQKNGSDSGETCATSEGIQQPGTAPIVLATRSRYRIELFRRLGLPYVAVPHRCDEKALLTPGMDAERAALLLARNKAMSVASAHPGAFVIGSDQIVDLDGEFLGKPGHPATANLQLQKMRGRVHRLVTAIALIYPDHSTIDEAVNIHELAVRDLTDGEIASYVDRDLPLDCAGSYKIEGLGIALFDSIAGSDFTSIIGLPMLTLVSMLRKAGIQVL